jgi:hypothetical protein
MRKLIATLFLSCLFSVPVFAQDYYVCNNGSDSNSGTLESPWATFDYAISKFRTMNAGDSILFCRGGKFTSSYPRIYNLNFTASLPGTIADYTPASGAQELPIILGGLSGALNFQEGGNADHDEGYEVKNLSIQGIGDGNGIFLFNDVDFVTIDGVIVDGFNIGVHSAAANAPNEGANRVNEHITLKNSQIINNKGQGWLGGGDYVEIDGNKFINNGFNEAIRNHNIYGAGFNHTVISNNELYKSAVIDGMCRGVSLVVHGVVDDLVIRNNWVHEDIGGAAPTCWGISVDPGYWTEESFNNIVISKNTVDNVGNKSIGCASCTNTWIIDNTIMHAQDFSATAISAPVRTEDLVKSARVLIGGNDVTLIDPNNRGKVAVVTPATDEFYQLGNAVH